MAVHIAFFCTHKDSALPTGGYVRRDPIVSAQRALGSSRAGSFTSRRADPSTKPVDFESRASHRGKIVKAYLTEEIAEGEAADAAARATAQDEAIHAHIFKKR